MYSLLSRQKEIIIYLINQNDYSPVKYIADIIKVSEKTVYRELKIIEEYLKEKYIKMEKRPGIGIKLLITKEQKMKLNFELHLNKEKVVEHMSIESRRLKIFSELLSNSPKRYSIQSLSDKYYISRASIVNDLKDIESRIKPYNLQLEKSQHGTKLIGSEIDIRNAMVSLINELITFNRGRNTESISERIDSITLHELFNQFGKDDFCIVETLLQDIESEMNYTIGEVYYINIITHILILIRRLKDGNKLYKENNRKIKVMDKKIYKVSEQTANKISEIFEIIIPKEEVYFIYQYLVSSGVGITSLNFETKKLLNDTSPEIIEITEEIIKNVSKIIQFELKTDNQLYESLILHLKAMMNRLKYSIVIKNPILNDIKEEFPAIYSLISLVILNISRKYQISTVSPDEIGYLTLYFQAAVEQNMKQKKVLVVCSSGVGSSHLLRSRIKHSFPEWDIVDIIPLNYLKEKYNLDEIDLIISTVKIPELNIPVAYVTALFNENDVRNVTEVYVKNALKDKKENFSFEIIKQFLYKKYIYIESEISLEEINTYDLINIIAKENCTKKKNINNYISRTNISDKFSVYLIDKKIVKKSCIGIKIKNNSSSKYKIDIIIAVKNNDDNDSQLLREIFELYNNNDLLKEICACKNINKIIRLINLS